jgi:ribonuclease HI
LRRKRQIKAAPLRASTGPLPDKIAGEYHGQLLVFTDASKRRQAAIAAVLFPDHAGEPVVLTEQVPMIGSNELELQGVLYGLLQARMLFPGRPIALFSDNQDAIVRLNRAKSVGIEQDAALVTIFPGLSMQALEDVVRLASFRWVKAHHYCRGNLLADAAAGKIAGQ